MGVEPITGILTESQATLEIDALLGEIAEHARSTETERDFYKNVLRRIIPALDAHGGAVWKLSRNSFPKLRCHINAPEEQLTGSSETRRSHDQLLECLRESGKPAILKPVGHSNGRPGPKNPTDYLLFLCPVTRSNSETTVLEVFQRPNVHRDAQRAHLRFLSAVGELFEEFFRNQRLRSLESQQSFWSNFEVFLRRLHADLKPRATAYLIANDGRYLLGCDRLSVALFTRKCRIVAISNVDRIDQRSNQVRLLERLANGVARVNEPLWWDGATSDLAPQLENTLEAYLDESHVRAIAVLPLTLDDEESKARRPIGVLILEQFSAPKDASIRRRFELVAKQSAVALANSIIRKRRGWLGIGGLVAWLSKTSRLFKLLSVLIALASVIVALMVFETEFTVEARGALQPLERREVFAPSNGIVQEVLVKHGQSIEQGMPVAVLRDPDLDLDLKRVLGELQTARKRLAAIETQRIGNAATSYDRVQQFTQLTAEAEELKESLANLEQQLALLGEQRDELTVRSPITGTVTTWNLRKLLLTRPVVQGQSLLSVSRTDGPWVLELDIPDEELFHIRNASRSVSEALVVSFTVATDPGTIYQGGLRQLAAAAETKTDDQRTVAAIVDIANEKIPQLTPGVSAIAKVHCGKRPVGFVWFRDVIEAVHTFWIFSLGNLEK